MLSLHRNQHSSTQQVTETSLTLGLQGALYKGYRIELP